MPAKSSSPYNPLLQPLRPSVLHVDRMINQIVEDEEIKRIRSAGGRLPMLASADWVRM